MQNENTLFVFGHWDCKEELHAMTNNNPGGRQRGLPKELARTCATNNPRQTPMTYIDEPRFHSVAEHFRIWPLGKLGKNSSVQHNI